MRLGLKTSQYHSNLFSDFTSFIKYFIVSIVQNDVIIVVLVNYVVIVNDVDY